MDVRRQWQLRSQLRVQAIVDSPRAPAAASASPPKCKWPSDGTVCNADPLSALLTFSFPLRNNYTPTTFFIFPSTLPFFRLIALLPDSLGLVFSVE